jgi:hypothetical protein
MKYVQEKDGGAGEPDSPQADNNYSDTEQGRLFFPRIRICPYAAIDG